MSILLAAASYPRKDPFFSNVSLLLHLDGTNGSTVFTDVTGKTVNGFTGAVLSTTTPKFGSASVSLTGTANLGLAFYSDLIFPTGNFTMEVWFKTTSNAAVLPILANFNGNALDRTGLQYGIFMKAGVLIMSAYSGVANNDMTLSGVWNDGQWHNLAFVRNGNVFTGYIDGVARATTTLAITLNNGNWGTFIGYYREGGTPVYFNGNLDELRITKGVARYTSDYLVQTGEFPNS